MLHCFQKKTQKTSKVGIDLAAKRYRGLGKRSGAVSEERFSRVWDAIEDTPAEAENLTSARR